MRFTKVPLIATLAAGALSLLAVLPALAQNDVRGRVGDSDFMVEVLKASGDSVAAPAYFNGVLYVSNSDGVERDLTKNADAAADLAPVANLVKVTVNNIATSAQKTLTNRGTLSDPDDDVQVSCIEVTVQNQRSGQKTTLYIATGGGSETFEVIPYGQENSSHVGCWDDTETPGTSINGAPVAPDKAVAQITARDGDTLRITAKGAISSADLTVDGKGPAFTDIAPAHKSYSSSTAARFQFTITDSGAGLRHDGEFTYDLGDEDPENVDKDNDGIRGSEPLSQETPTLGSAEDINLELPVGTDLIHLGTNRWRLIEIGRAYSMDVSLPLSEGGNDWQLNARDRVGNQTVSDSDSGKSGKNPHTITVDTGKPTLSEARTGVAFSESKKKEVVDRSSVALTLQDGDAGGAEQLSAVDHNDFRVTGHAVTGASLIGVKADCDDTDTDPDVPVGLDVPCIETPKSRVYLQLADDLAPNETPEVQMLGGAAVDLAGNSNDPGKIKALDKLAPGLTVTINPGVEQSGRPVIRKSGEVTIRVVSDETLRRRPSVYFATITNTGTKTDATLQINVVRPGQSITAQAAANTWERVYRANTTGLSGLDGLIAVIVTGDDAAGNVGASDGVTLGADGLPTASDRLNLEDLIAGALLIEVDDNLANPTFALAPYRSSTELTTTESSRPFITIEFAEADEAVYDVGATDAETNENVTTVRLSSDEEEIDLDSHSGVRITLATLDGEDVSSDLAAINSRKYTLTTSDLEVGRRTLKITGVDDAGNSATREYKFDVVSRRAYELSLTPGWNLVSLPGTPTDSTVASVLDSAPRSKIVLSYQNDEWVTAVRVQGGEWQGTLTDIVGGYGYWIQTEAFEKVSTRIPETDTSSVLPTAAVTAGWNLLGVVDVDQAKAGDAPSGGGDPDNYFSNLSWSVAYSYDTRQNDWTRILPKAAASSDAIANGKGYWVWATAAGTLVP